MEDRRYLASDPIVTVDTNFGNFQLELFPADAPKTVANFLSYVESGKYADAIFSRSVANFVVQAGGITSASATYTSNSQFVPVPQIAAIPLEYKLPNTAGTIAMARSSSPNSATDEWFVNLVDNTSSLGPGGVDPNGYAAFGKVIGNGMQVINAIAGLTTKNAGSVQTNSNPPSSTDLSTLPLGPNNQLVQISSMTLDSVDGAVFSDANGNGQQDAGEAGVASRTVFVDVDGTGKPDGNNPSAITDANGNYSIAGVKSGTFIVRELLPAGGGLTTPLKTVTFAADQTITGVNFGEGPSIIGTVFNDLNDNGQLDSGEPGVPGRTVFLNVDGAGKPDSSNPSTTTDVNGHFSFSGLAPNTYSVMESLSNATISTNTQAIMVNSNHPAAVANIGELPSLVGVVFDDVNVNGMIDAGEPGLAGITVFLNVDGSGAPSSHNPSTATDANGRFTFTGLAAGVYKVQELISPGHGMTQTTPDATVTVGASQPPTVNIGDVLTSTIAPLLVSVDNVTPSSDANTALIDNLFFTLLGRHADTAALAHWQAAMSAGASHSSVAQSIWDSREHRGVEVDQFYHAYLGRDAEPAGRNYWINTFSTWGNEKIVSLNFLISPEYQRLHSSNLDFITALYNDVALRPADAEGLSFWQNALTSGKSRFQVAQAFLNMQEANTRLVDSFYEDFLHRAADSTTQTIINNLEQDKVSVESTAISVLASDEYASRVTKAG